MQLRQIDQNIGTLNGVKDLVQTYEEIAASKMQKIKGSVLNNRQFLDGLFEIYKRVKFSQEQEMVEGHQRITLDQDLDQQNKTVLVLLSANTGLYGGIVNETYRLFKKGFVENSGPKDIVVVGKVGRGFIENEKGTLGIKEYTFFDLPDNTTEGEGFTKIVQHILSYSKVIVYHGKFESLISQKPIENVVSGQLPKEYQESLGKFSYIFEPSLAIVVDFFESEIKASVFEQSLHESGLSKFAARMVNLDSASVRIEEHIKKAKFDKQRQKHRNANKRQLAMLSSYSHSN